MIQTIETWLETWGLNSNRFLDEISIHKNWFNSFLMKILDISEKWLKGYEIDLDMFTDLEKYEEFKRNLFWMINGKKEDIVEKIKADKNLLKLIWYDPWEYEDEFSEYLLMEFIRYYINDIFREIEKNNRIMNSFN